MLGKLGLPKAPEKDQEPAFNTIWFGIEYFSKASTIGLSQKKWLKLRIFVAHKFMTKE